MLVRPAVKRLFCLKAKNGLITASMALSAVHNLERVLRVLAVSEYFLSEIVFGSPRYWDHL